ncbi:MAG: dihydrodipicolinate synthase family protein [Syntrophales bacterium]
MNDRQTERIKLVQTMFPDGIPRLWCPLLTHYRDDKTIDFDRMESHFAYISPWVKGFLIPGSTGDGWELTEEETLQVTEFAVAHMRGKDIHLLIGLLRPDVGGVKGTLSAMKGRNVIHLLENKGADPVMSPRQIYGITICPPRGKALSQAEIDSGLSEILDMALPTALYQLPQLTENEAAPETFARLTEKYSNLIFFKDSSGNDRIASSSVDKGGVFLVRGAEGDYARWLKEAGGPYDGFLLSTANSFPRELRSIIENLEKGDFKAAGETSGRLSTVIGKVFTIVQPLPHGNAFTNANKAIDHFLAYGPNAASRPGPLLHAGVRLTREILTATGEVLDSQGLLPERGYWE